MPSKHIEPPGEEPCRRCKENTFIIVVRSEPLCRDCFIRYVHTKVIKRMESFRVRNADPNRQRKILLPVSFGVSSIPLLNIMDHHLKTQKSKTGRTGFALTILFVDTLGVEKSPANPNLLIQLEERFPDHHYAKVHLEDVFRTEMDDSLLELMPYAEVSKVLPLSEQLAVLINSLTSATARADVISMLKTRLIVQQAQFLGCEGILWGDSTTRLAEKSLTETAKGRGFSLPWQIADGESPYGITFNYPMKDVLKKELVSYVELVQPPLTSLVHREPTNTQISTGSKNTTIDDLMKHYFESVEANFPSIVSNVVRTIGKLEAPYSSSSDSHCKLCKMPVVGGQFGIHGWGGDQEDGLAAPVGNVGQGLCYGCSRSMPQVGR
ncbi:hypothetical protein CC78DRAFT_473114 [Lojkania enalia]|uniref:Cytoplasmic tRNA 2-thiolation protein 2 n=1 Tax=Lojkania enalia TaxID=147567 RepID=A0A9P4MZI8_9PLEO|nr:hypothetical protein CC78DRAFT_473114 [Didymosphaeria enalia]